LYSFEHFRLNNLTHRFTLVFTGSKIEISKIREINADAGASTREVSPSLWGWKPLVFFKSAAEVVSILAKPHQVTHYNILPVLDGIPE
jgi:glutathionylspermidine synthase